MTGKLITAEEFARMPNPPDGSRQELVRGRIETMPPPGGRHGFCCSKMDRRVGGFIEQHGLGSVFANDTGFITGQGPDTVRGADVSFWSKERLPEIPEGYIDVAPDLAIEVLSPHDRFARLQLKVNEYLTKGVRLIWIVDPEDRSVTVYRPNQQPAILFENDTLAGEDVLPGFSCLVAELMP